MTSYSHPKCYAQSTCKCSKKISAEHIISKNLLKVFERNKTVRISGLPWMEKEKFTRISSQSVKSKVLCKRHNELLSPLDAEAGKFLRCIQGFDDDFNSPNPKDEEQELNGHTIEKWMLKTVCGLIASNQIMPKGDRTVLALKEIYIDLLFNDMKWPENWGLYFRYTVGEQIHKYDCFGVSCHTGGGEVKGAEFLINNFKFFLVLGQPENPDSFGLYRLNKIHMTDQRVAKTIEFNWLDKKFDKWIALNRTATTSEAPKEWPDWMKD